MHNPQNELPEDDEDWLPAPYRSRHWGVIIGVLVLIALAAIGGTVAFHALTQARIAPAPTAVNYGPSIPTPWVEPSIMCNDAIQKIEHDQIAYVLIYRQKDGGPAIPANAIISLEVLPRGIPYQGDPAQSVQSDLLNIYTTYPDHVCYPQMLVAVKQVNKHLPNNKQVKVGWYYGLS